MGNIISSLFNDKLFYDQVFKTQVKHTTKKFKPNKKILKQGNKYSYFGFIKSGTVRVILNEDGNGNGKKELHTIIASLEQNDIFGEFSLFGDYPASAHVITVTEAEIIMIDVKSFRDFLEADTQIGYKIFFEMLQNLVHRLHHTNTTVLHLLNSAIDFQKQLHQLIRQP